MSDNEIYTKKQIREEFVCPAHIAQAQYADINCKSDTKLKYPFEPGHTLHVAFCAEVSEDISDVFDTGPFKWEYSKSVRADGRTRHQFQLPYSEDVINNLKPFVYKHYGIPLDE